MGKSEKKKYEGLNRQKLWNNTFVTFVLHASTQTYVCNLSQN